MMPEQIPITGREDKNGLSAPLQALVEFYDAFNSRDLEKMSKNWAQTDDISMDNPLGGIKRGWKEIQSVYEHIFKGPAKVYVELMGTGGRSIIMVQLMTLNYLPVINRLLKAEVSGAVSQGYTIKEAIANLKEATELYLEEYPLGEVSKPLMTTFEAAVNA
jgi:hypothetical protein